MKNRILSFDEFSQQNQLFEKFITAEMNDLEDAMKKDIELKNFLNTPGKNLPEHFKYLISEIFFKNEERTLLNMIELAITTNDLSSKTISYFSQDKNNKLTGFVAYKVNKFSNEVTEIKMFSFSANKKDGVLLLLDLKNLLSKLKKEHRNISWCADKNNPANKIYFKALETFKGTYYIGKNEIHYNIRGEFLR